MSNKVLVIGATSKVGSELVDQLLSHGESVKAATRRPGDYRPPEGVEATPFDYDVYQSFKPALQDVDRVFMLTKWTDLHPEVALKRFIDRAAVDEVRHIVHLSVLGIDQKPAAGLPLVEKHLAASGVGYTVLHPNWFMQGFSRGFFTPPIRDLSTIIAPVGDAAVSFVDARDVASVAAAALADSATHTGHTYPLTGGRAYTYAEVAEIVAAATDRRVVFQDATDEDFRSTLSNYWETEQIDYVARLFAHVRDGLAEPVDPTLGSILVREPTTFETFARDHVAAWE